MRIGDYQLFIRHETPGMYQRRSTTCTMDGNVLRLDQRVEWGAAICRPSDIVKIVVVVVVFFGKVQSFGQADVVVGHAVGDDGVCDVDDVFYQEE
mmetsp:Transcript_19167/g.29629  ORF Transcript_19167/g.29629 Transcript_19167/m.29629 type:complete len:95 (-) Transcript_19167:5-289(-)